MSTPILHPRPTETAILAFVQAAELAKAGPEFRDGLAKNMRMVHDMKKRAALDIAIGYGYERAFKRLLRAGSGIEIHDGDGMAALGYACALGEAKMAKLLIDAGARVDGPRQGCPTPLMLACKHDHPKCARLVIQAGADLELRFGATESTASAIDMARLNGAHKRVEFIERARAEREAAALSACAERPAPASGRPRAL